MGMQALGTGVFGTIAEGSVDIVLGRNSSALKGIKILPGIIDCDYTGEIKIMIEAGMGVLVIPQGARIAQLVLLPMFRSTNPFFKQERGDKGFGTTGSPGAFWVSSLENCPTLTLTINGKRFQGLPDTGADSSVIAKKHWPTAWPLQLASTALQGVGTASSPECSTQYLNWEDEEGHKGIFKPFVLEHLPLNLWGRDVLQAMGAVLTTEPVQRMLSKQGFVPGQGLGKNLQGDVQILADKKIIQQSPGQRAGLGNFS